MHSMTDPTLVQHDHVHCVDGAVPIPEQVRLVKMAW